MGHRQNHSPLLYLVAVIAILTVARWAGLGNRHALEYATLGLIVALLIWGRRMERADRQHSRRGI
jgi:cation transport ATPase